MTTTTRTFQRGETVVCSCTVRNDSDLLIDPDTTFTLSITDPSGSLVVTDQAMVKDVTGRYHYDYTPGAQAVLGSYAVRYKAVDSQRTTITDDRFLLVA